MPNHSPKLTAVVIAGGERARAQKVVDRLGAQTAAALIELVIVDTASAKHPRLRAPESIPTHYLERSDDEPWGSVRAAAVWPAQGSVVAFTEDHCLPSFTWAEALIRASSDDWVVAGYTFVNSNPETYCSRAGFLADYGEWAFPVPPGPTPRISGNNIAYRRDALIKFGERLGRMLDSDVLAQEELKRTGKEMVVVRDAVSAHQNHEDYRTLFDGNFVHCRIIAAGRVENGNWGYLRRIGYALAVPPLVPLMKLGRLFGRQARRRDFRADIIACLPVVFGVFIWSAVGESMGYLFGFGDALERFKHVEISVARIARVG